MKHPKLISLLVMLIIFGSVAGICYALAGNHQIANQTHNPMPKLTIPEEIRNAAISYIAGNHTETGQFIDNILWTGGRTTPEGILGAETYTYQSQGGNAAITYPVVATPIYNSTVDYSTVSGTIEIPYHIMWECSWQDGYLTEASCDFVQ
jgi:hypothetical protein